MNPVQGWSDAKCLAFRTEFYRFLGHCSVNSKERGPMVLGDYVFNAQRMVIDGIFDGLKRGIHDNKFLKSRQLGISTISRAFSTFWLGMHDGLQGALVFDTDANKNNARRELESMINGLPKKLAFPAIRHNNRDGIILENESKILFMAAGSKAGRSGGGLGRSAGLNFAHCSEMCTWGNVEGLTSFKNSLSKQFPNRLYIWESPLALDTPILTPFGWTTIGAIKEGDFVYDENGNATEVVGLSPVFEGRRCYEIEFNTGEKIIADASHKWQVERMGSSCSRWSTKVVTTDQLDPRKDRIWIGGPVEGIEQKLPIHPYLVGAWLGDGHTEAVRITCGDQDMDELRNSLKCRGIECGPITKFKGRGGGVFGIHGMMPSFRELNLIGNKHIPELYLRATVLDRLELLRGLMDTDGSITEQAHCLFTNSCIPLINGFCELLSSLGIRYHINWMYPGKKKFAGGREYECEPYAQIGFMAPEGMDVFSLTRKLKRQTYNRKRRVRSDRVARIVSIREVSSIPVKCISVDTPTHLFKVGRTLIPTHNTARGRNLWFDMWNEAMRDDLNQNAVFIGWWAREDQRLLRGTPQFERYAADPLSEREEERIKKVKQKYGIDIDIEQVAWFRMMSDPNKSLEDGEEEDPLFRQEQPWDDTEAFILSGSSFFSDNKLTQVANETSSPNYTGYKFYPGSDFLNTKVEKVYSSRDIQLKVWEEPLPGSTYVVACDPAFGHDEKNNNSAIQVIRCFADKVEQVAEFANASTPTDHFAWVIASVAGWYSCGATGEYKNNVLVIQEINGPGEAVWNAFKALKEKVESPYARVEIIERGLKNIFNNVRNYIYTRSDSMGMGHCWNWKCLAIDTPIPTPDGWKKMGGIKAGDTLFDDRGEHCSVLAVSPIQSGHNCYEISFDDGQTIVADEEHLWSVSDGRLLRTIDLVEGDFIEMSSPLNLPKVDLPVDPYVLGVWLGDGYSADSRFCAHKDDMPGISSALESCGAKLGPIGQDKRNNTQYRTISGLRPILRDIGVLNNKRIPKQYLRASIEQRAELLRGLMDTDGSIGMDGQCGFTTSSKSMADAVSELLRSLGIKARFCVRNRTVKYKGKDVECVEAYQFWFSSYDLSVFRLERKKSREIRLNQYGACHQSKRARRQYINSVRRVESVPVVCIAVDSPSKLFLAGKGMVPTHNTTTALKISIMERLRDFVNSGNLVIRSIDMLEEMKGIVRDGDTIGAEGMARDDRTYAMAMAIRAWEERLRRSLTAQNLTKERDEQSRRVSVVDKYALFHKSQLDAFFQQKKMERISTQALNRRNSWRYR